MFYDFAVNVAASLAYDLAKTLAARFRQAALGDDETRALQEAISAAFRSALVQVASKLDPIKRTHLEAMLRPFIMDEKIANILIDCALLDEALPLPSLYLRFHELGIDPSSLANSLGIRPDVFFSTFISAFEESLYGVASGASNALYYRISLKLLARTYEIQEKQLGLLYRVLDGQTAAKHQLEDEITQLEGRVGEIQSLLGKLVRVSGTQRLDVVANANASVVIVGNDNEVTLVDGGLLASWWNEIGPDESTLLHKYLRTVDLVFAPLYFPLMRVSKLLLLEDVYIDLPLIKPTSEEALLRPQRPGQRTLGTPVPRIDDIIKLSERSALVGIMGMGKTTTLRYLAYSYAHHREDGLFWRSEDLVPFYVRLRDLAGFWTVAERLAGPSSLSQALAKAVNLALGSLLSARSIERVLNTALEGGNALVLLDSLDEYQALEAERLEFVTAFQSLWRAEPFKYNHVLLTSRPYKFLNPLGFPQYTFQTLEQGIEPLVERLGRALLTARELPLGEEDLVDWTSRLSAAIHVPRLQEFWSPFYITLMVCLGTGTASAAEGVALLSGINRLADLYWHFLRRTIDWESKKPDVPVVDEELAILALSYIAYYTFVEPIKHGIASPVSREMRCAPEEATHFLQFWLGTGLLVEDTFSGELSFWHSGFQAFGVAFALADLLRRDDNGRARVSALRKEHEWTPEWRDAIWPLFMALAGGR
jgi:hypothetical protein